MSSGSASSTQILPFKLDESEKFNGENWTAFEMIMMAEGGPRGLINYWENCVTVPGPALFPTQTTGLSSLTPNEYEYAQRESCALSSIIRNITDIFGFGLDTLGTSHAAWTRLKTQYGAHSDLEGDKVSGDGGHIEKMRRLLKEANDAGAAIKEETFITILLDSFPESWDPVVSILHGEKDLMIVVARLSAHGERLAGRGKISSGPTSSTTTTSNQALQASIDALALQVQSLSSRKDNARPSNGKSHPVNEHCKGIGHTIDECWKIGGGKQGQYPPWWKGKRDAQIPTANLAQIPNPDTGVTTNVFALNGSLGEDTKRMIEEQIQEKAWVAKGTEMLDSSRLYSDSGVSTHFVKQRLAFSAYIPLTNIAGGLSKDGVMFKVEGTGTVAIKTSMNGMDSVVKLERALHCPDISANLISVSRLDKDGWKVVYGG
ncbi:uncharacterized protein ARMOST_16058 [Armillaria ostoyae]|uniref:Retrovirus-related Pol polyprotein from transposon TNT 1-94-like beta-barrel domain-containing protein n=1 Tax=Armillaria ostoyae TaxID=47428 RepID=A0A284RV34_ARMOS|nr:uncharacterized protein ARMOST_16058 [Armillaria ostoyae]